MRGLQQILSFNQHALSKQFIVYHIIILHYILAFNKNLSYMYAIYYSIFIYIPYARLEKKLIISRKQYFISWNWITNPCANSI